MFVYHISLSVILLGVHARLWLLGHLLILAIYLFFFQPSGTPIAFQALSEVNANGC